uniref:Uncharacterized protein n=2 Tax=Cercopithecinae TaxID=9528 RepID=A0A2K5XTM6_MANLE|nr:unnamed protein product [Macaca fascicularis]
MFWELQDYIHHPEFWHTHKNIICASLGLCYLTNIVKHSMENHTLAGYVGHQI